MANPQTVRNEAAAARALLRTLVKQADLDAGDCVHENLPPRECVRCTARRELAATQASLLNGVDQIPSCGNPPVPKARR